MHKDDPHVLAVHIEKCSNVLWRDRPFVTFLPLPLALFLFLISAIFVPPRSQEFKDFLRKALDKNPETRPSALQLLEVGTAKLHSVAL